MSIRSDFNSDFVEQVYNGMLSFVLKNQARMPETYCLDDFFQDCWVRVLINDYDPKRGTPLTFGYVVAQSVYRNLLKANRTQKRGGKGHKNQVTGFLRVHLPENETDPGYWILARENNELLTSIALDQIPEIPVLRGYNLTLRKLAQMRMEGYSRQEILFYTRMGANEFAERKIRKFTSRHYDNALQTIRELLSA